MTAVTATRSKESTVAPIHFLVTVSLRDGAELLGFSPRQRPRPAAASVVMGILLSGCAFHSTMNQGGGCGSGPGSGIGSLMTAEVLCFSARARILTSEIKLRLLSLSN